MNTYYEIENQTFTPGNTSNIQSLNSISSFKIKSFTFQTLGSLDWKIISVFGSLGYNTGSANFKTTGALNGQYQGATTTETKELEIPNDIEFLSNSFSATLGSTIHLRNFKLFGSFAFQEYNTANFGLAISIK